MSETLRLDPSLEVCAVWTLGDLESGGVLCARRKLGSCLALTVLALLVSGLCSVIGARLSGVALVCS